MKYKMIPKFEPDEVEEIILLSIEEWEKAKKIPTVPDHTSRWWLRSPGENSDCACYIDYFGYVYGYCNTDLTVIGVRPTFKIPGLSFNVGEKIFVGNTLCTVIYSEYILSDSIICKHRFDENTNDYNKSEIKKFINSDEFKKML